MSFNRFIKIEELNITSLFFEIGGAVFLIFLDSETGGLNCHIHRVLEIAFRILDSRTNQIVTTYSSLVKHNKDIWKQRTKESLFITELTEEYVNQRGKTESQVAEEIIAVFECYGLNKHNSAFICQNPALDRIFFSQLITVETQQSKNWPYHWLDLASMFWALRGYSHNKSMDISVLTKDNIAKHLGLDTEDKPHRALRGVEHLISCYSALMENRLSY